MKHLGLLKQFLLLFALIVGSTSVWGQEEVTLSISDYASENDWENATAYTDNISINSDITVSCVSGGNNGKYYTTNTSWRHYEGDNGAITITTTNGTLNSVTFTYDKNNNGVLIYNNTNYTTGTECTAVSGETTATFTVGRTQGTKAGNVQIKTIVVNYTPASPTDPTITANNVDIEYNATGGNIAFTLNSAGTEGTISASTDDTWITLGNQTTSPISFTCTANEANTARTATVTLTYTYNTDETVTKNITITQAAAPVVYTTIPDLFDAATGTATNVNVTFGNWVVSGVSGSNAYVTDNNGNGFIIYTSSHGFSVNDKLSGTVTGTPLKLYNGAAEFTNLTASTSGLTVSNDGEITVITDKAIAGLSGVNTGAVITLNNLTYNGTELTDGANTIKPYNTLFSGTFENGKTYNVTGVYLQFNTTKEILPRSANDIEEVVSTEPSITLSANSVNATAEGKDGTITVTYNNFTTVVAEVQFYDATGTTELTGDNVPTWIQADINADDDVYYVIGANTGEARTAYMKVYAVGDEGEAYSELITVSQAAYVAPPTPVDGYYVKITSTDDITDGQYLIVYEGGVSNNVTVPSVAFNGGLETLDASENGIEVTIANNKISATSALQAAEFTINVTNGTIKSASGLYIGKTAYSNGLDASSSTAYTNTFEISDGEAVITASGNCTLRYNYASDQLRFRYYKNGQQAVQLYKFIPPTQTIERTKAYTTFCSTNALDFTDVEGLEAYVVSAMTANSATIKQVFETPAGTGLILKRTDATKTSFTIPVIETASAITPNYMVGVNVDTDMSDVADAYANAYILKDGLFYKCNGGTLAAGKAYLNDAGNAWTNSEAPSFSLIVDGETTGIESLTPALSQGEGMYYDLSGRRVAEPTKGIYILNGKKVVVK